MTGVIRSLRDGRLDVYSADATAHYTQINFVNGGLSWTEKRPTNIIKDRGILAHARKAFDDMLEGQFTFLMTDQAQFPDAIRDLTLDGDWGGAGADVQTLYAGWINPETFAAIKAGATLFGRTVKAGDTVAGSAGGSDYTGRNLLFTITDPATGSAGEYVLFMGVVSIEADVTEGEEANEITISFSAGVKQPHTWAP